MTEGERTHMAYPAAIRSSPASSVTYRASTPPVRASAPPIHRLPAAALIPEDRIFGQTGQQRPDRGRSGGQLVKGFEIVVEQDLEQVEEQQLLHPRGGGREVARRRDRARSESG